MFVRNIIFAQMKITQVLQEVEMVELAEMVVKFWFKFWGTWLTSLILN